MESCFCRASACPLFCVAKAVLFALLAVFVLCFPLGDPYVLCNGADRSNNQKLTACGFCDVYMKALKLFNKTKEFAELAWYKIVDVLYEAKLKFYSLLERVDRKDLYQSVCCSDSVDKTEENQDRKRLGCSCSRKCCRNKLQT